MLGLDAVAGERGRTRAWTSGSCPAARSPRSRSSWRSADWYRSSGSSSSIDAVARARTEVPGLRLLVVGEGYERPLLEAKIEARGRRSWIDLPGHLSDAELADAYRTGVGGGEHVVARGLEHDHHRGGRVRDSRRGRPTSPDIATP